MCNELIGGEAPVGMLLELDCPPGPHQPALDALAVGEAGADTPVVLGVWAEIAVVDSLTLDEAYQRRFRCCAVRPRHTVSPDKQERAV